MSSDLLVTLRDARIRRGLSATRLAESVGLSRQAYAALEAGRSVPSTHTALKLARALDTSVEALFQLDDTEIDVPVEEDLAAGVRVRLVDVGGKTSALPILPSIGLPVADGVSVAGTRSRWAVRPLGPSHHKAVVALAGCDPATTVLRALLRDAADIDLVWTESGSGASLERLARGEVHVAGSHLADTAVRVRQVVPFPCEIVRFATWELGLVVAPGNPLGLGSVDDLARPGVRFVNRERGAGSRHLLDQHLQRAGIPPHAITGYDTAARGHLAVALAVQAGLADAGIAVRGAAAALGLGFVHWQDEPYQLVVPRHLVEAEPVRSLLDLLGRDVVRRQVEALGGYDAHDMGLAT